MWEHYFGKSIVYANFILIYSLEACMHTSTSLLNMSITESVFSCPIFLKVIFESLFFVIQYKIWNPLHQEQSLFW